LGSLPLHFAPDFLRHPLRENAHAAGTFRNEGHTRSIQNRQPTEFVRLLTRQLCCQFATTRASILELRSTTRLVCSCPYCVTWPGPVLKAAGRRSTQRSRA